MRCFAGTVDDAVERVIDRVLSRLGGYAVLCNVHVLMTAQERLDVHRGRRRRLARVSRRRAGRLAAAPARESARQNVLAAPT